MNALPVGAERLKDEKSRARYFDDLVRWNFDVAYTAYYAQPLDQVIGDHKSAYIGFAEDAHKRGLPACVQIQSTLCHPSVLSLEEAQYHLDNSPDVLGDGRFFASFASQKWKDYLKELTRIFIEDYGYDWVVFEEPMYRVDIPGQQDHFYALYKEEYPDVDYPTARDETPAYLKVQKLKGDVLVRFYGELTAYAKSVGASKTGVMPWFFIPTIENTPEGTLNTSCDIGRIAALQGLDFLVVRMQPDNILAHTMRTGDDMEQSPLLYYPEVMAHASDKPFMAVTNPVDEHTNYPELPLIPLQFFQKALLASMAAAPNGMTRHWYGQRYGEDTEHMKFMTEVNRFVSRLGNPVSKIAFLFSYRGGQHAEPCTYETAWQSYWALTRQLLFAEKLPMRTLYADALASGLEANPELKVIILDERSPVSIGQSQILRQWWQAAPGRALVVFGGGRGLSADTDTPGEVTLAESFPSIVQAIGVKQRPERQVETGGGRAHLVHVSRQGRTAFLGPEIDVPVDSVANVERVFGSRGMTLYSEEASGTPVIVENRVGETLAYFCGIELSHATARTAAMVVKYALQRLNAQPPTVEGSGAGLLWNSTRAGYTIVVNAEDAPARAVVAHNGNLMWDVINRDLLPRDTTSIDIEPMSFRLFRQVGKRSKLYDVADVVQIQSVSDGAGRADIRVLTRSKVSVLVKVEPRDVRVDGRLQRFAIVDIGTALELILDALTPGEHMITLRW
jgi:hypothetical protein